MSSLVLPPLYAILDPEQTQGRAAGDALRQLLAGGAAIVQLRVKTMTPRDFLELARFARAETRVHGCKLIINDRVDVALACDADGVHLGQDDLPLAAGRKLVGQKIVGISTHDIEKAQEAEQNGADYIGFGPMFSTTTKNTGYAARGVEMLGKIHAAVKLPIVAIGGINAANARELAREGAQAVAVISAVFGGEDVTAAARAIATVFR